MKCKIGLIALLVFLVTIYGVLASSGESVVTLDVPAESATVSGATQILSVEITNADNITYAWFKMRCTNCGNDTFIQIATVDASQQANNSDELNVTFDSTQFEDSSTYIFSVTVQNMTGALGENFTADTSTSVTIDNTVPGTPVISSSVIGTSVTLSAAINSKNVTTCVGTFSGNNPGSLTQTMTDDGAGTCSKALSDLASGSYTWSVVGTDGTDTSIASVSNTFSISSGAGAGGGVAALSSVADLTQDETGNVQFTLRNSKQLLGIPLFILFGVIGVILGIFVLVSPIPLPFVGKIAAPVVLGIVGLVIGLII